jgi:NADP-dependent 3-hydroxy acid dehydrogenase YdfG
VKSLKNEVAIVTGASRGVGKAISLKLAEEGCHVAVVARTETELAELAGEMTGKGVRALPIVADVSQEEDVKKVVEQTLSQFGRVDILVNNAGIGRYGSLEELTVEDYDDMMDTNMRSTFLCTKFVFPKMKEQRKGHILNVASVAGLKGLLNESIYCSTKFAQVGFAQALDYEARPFGVKVSSICPGGINTTFAFGTGRVPGDPRFEDFLNADEVADVILFVLQQPEQARIIQVAMRPMSEPL